LYVLAVESTLGAALDGQLQAAPVSAGALGLRLAAHSLTPGSLGLPGDSKLLCALVAGGSCLLTGVLGALEGWSLPRDPSALCELLATIEPTESAFYAARTNSRERVRRVLATAAMTP